MHSYWDLELSEVKEKRDREYVKRADKLDDSKIGIEKMSTSIVTQEHRDSMTHRYLLKYCRYLDVGAARLPA